MSKQKSLIKVKQIPVLVTHLLVINEMIVFLCDLRFCFKKTFLLNLEAILKVVHLKVGLTRGLYMELISSRPDVT